jgi:signal transduction histidine kinase
VRAFESPYITDWYVISLRWLTLLGLTVSISLGGQIKDSTNLLLLGLAAWNVILTIIAGMNRRLQKHREINLGIDLAVAGVFFWVQGGLTGPGAWVGVLPILTAAFYFELRGALLAAGIISLIEIGGVLWWTTSFGSFVAGCLLAAVTIVLAALLGYLSQQVFKQIRLARQQVASTQKQKLRVDNERLRAIYNLTTALTSSLNYKRVIDTALDLSLSAMNPDSTAHADGRLVSAVLLFNKEETLDVASARRLTPADMRVTLPGNSGKICEAIDKGQPLLVEDIIKDPELGRIVAFRACKQLFIIPLRSGLNMYGVLVFGHPEPGYFGPDRAEVLGIIGHQTVIAIQNARLYQDLRDEHDRMMDAQEEARKKLARDLHDGPTQSVAAMAMRVNMARRLMEKDLPAANNELGKIEELARRTTKEIRHMLFTLRPLVLESQGLVAALKVMAEKMKETYSQQVTINVDENALKEMEVGKQSVVFYIVEEAVNNARKHARAENVWVRMRPVQDNLALLEVIDNGVGFDVEAVNKAYDKRGSLGMVNLRERTELVNGVLNIQSTLGKGTRVQVFIPLTEEAAERLHHATGP